MARLRNTFRATLLATALILPTVPAYAALDYAAMMSTPGGQMISGAEGASIQRQETSNNPANYYVKGQDATGPYQTQFAVAKAAGVVQGDSWADSSVTPLGESLGMTNGGNVQKDYAFDTEATNYVAADYANKTVVPSYQNVEQQYRISQDASVNCLWNAGGSGCGEVLSGHSPFTPAVTQEIVTRVQTDNGGELTVAQTITTNSSGTTVQTTSMYCLPSVSQMLAKNGAAAVNNWTALAEDPKTGYSLLGGQGVLQAAGLSGSGNGSQPSNNAFGGMNFYQASCLGNILNSGISIVFSPPNLSQILDQLKQAACNEVQNLFGQLEQPLQQALYQNMNVGGFLPGSGLGELGGAVNGIVSSAVGNAVQVGQSSNGSLVSVGVQGQGTVSAGLNGVTESSGTSSVLDNTSAPTSVPSFGSMLTTGSSNTGTSSGGVLSTITGGVL